MTNVPLQLSCVRPGCRYPSRHCQLKARPAYRRTPRYPVVVKPADLDGAAVLLPISPARANGEAFGRHRCCPTKSLWKNISSAMLQLQVFNGEFTGPSSHACRSKRRGTHTMRELVEITNAIRDGVPDSALLK